MNCCERRDWDQLTYSKSVLCSEESIELQLGHPPHQRLLSQLARESEPADCQFKSRLIRFRRQSDFVKLFGIPCNNFDPLKRNRRRPQSEKPKSKPRASPAERQRRPSNAKQETLDIAKITSQKREFKRMQLRMGVAKLILRAPSMERATSRPRVRVRTSLGPALIL